jgi:hypothetical protein
MAALFGNQPSSLTAPTAQPSVARPGPPASPPTTSPTTAGDVDSLISEAARDLADYQRFTAEGKLGEAGQRLEALKQKLERLASQRR